MQLATEPCVSISCLWLTLGMNWGGRELLWEEAGSQTKTSIDVLFRTAGDRITAVRLQRGFLPASLTSCYTFGTRLLMIPSVRNSESNCCAGLK